MFQLHHPAIKFHKSPQDMTTTLGMNSRGLAISSGGYAVSTSFSLDPPINLSSHCLDVIQGQDLRVGNLDAEAHLPFPSGYEVVSEKERKDDK